MGGGVWYLVAFVLLSVYWFVGLILVVVWVWGVCVWVLV